MICNDCIHFEVCGITKVLKTVNECPYKRINAGEVKHGEWLKNDNGTYSCSLCQSWIPNEQYYYARFCLHCGANMRREAKQNERK